MSGAASMGHGVLCTRDWRAGIGSVTVVLGLALATAAQESAGVFQGMANELGAVGDLDGDGREELLVAYYDDLSSGQFLFRRVEVRSGSQASTVLRTFLPSNDSLFGAALDGRRDFDGDGLCDILIGAPYDPDSPAEEYVVVLSGANGTELFRHEQLTADSFGSSARLLGDVNGDGHCDIAISAPTNPAGGRLVALSGLTGAELYSVASAAPGALLGNSLDVLGDQNGDGIDDLLVGMPGAGGALVVSGASGSVLMNLPGPVSNALDDTYAIGIGDVTGDGIDDVVIQALTRVSIHAGGTGQHVKDILLEPFLGSIPASPYRAPVLCRVGDLDRSGTEDLAVSFPGRYFQQLPLQFGAAAVIDIEMERMLSYTVGSGCWTATHGWAMTALRHGSKSPRLAVSSPFDGTSRDCIAPNGRGTVEILRLRPAHELRTVHGPKNDTHFGYDVAGGGDLNGDGLPDYAIAAPKDANSPGLEGAVYLYQGRSGALIRELRSGAMDDRFGFSIAIDGDADGDGHADVLVGAPNADLGGTDSGSVYVLLG